METKPACAICDRPAVAFVKVPGSSKQYRYNSCYRCEFHLDKAQKAFGEFLNVTMITEEPKKPRLKF